MPKGGLLLINGSKMPVFGQWSHFKRERGFYRSAQTHLRPAFPSLPDRALFNRLQREHRNTIVCFGLYLVDLLPAARDVYEVLESTAVVTRDAKRLARSGLAGEET